MPSQLAMRLSFDFFLISSLKSVRPTFRLPLRRISRSTFRPVCRPVISPLRWRLSMGYHKAGADPRRLSTGLSPAATDPRRLSTWLSQAGIDPGGYQGGYRKLKQTDPHAYICGYLNLKQNLDGYLDGYVGSYPK